MYCYYHPSASAPVSCSSCRRALCSACDHRIKGYAYCQDCIVLGIQSLSSHTSHTSSHQGTRHSRKTARLAALFGILLPGLGAVYNRQNVKAVVHFVTVIGLLQLRHIGLFGVGFFLGGLAFYVYSIIDAYRTAQLVAQGESAAADEERFKKQLASRAPAIGLLLLITGGLLVVNILNPLGLSVVRLIPAALILVGGYLLTLHFKRVRDAGYETEPSSRSRHALIQGRFGGHSSARKEQSQPWKKR